MLDHQIHFPESVTRGVDFTEMAETIVQGFKGIPIADYDGMNNPSDENKARHRRAFQQELDNGAIVVEAVNHDAFAVWYPPDYKRIRTGDDEKDERPNAQEIRDFFDLMHRYESEAEQKHELKDVPHWHLHFLCKRPTGNTKASDLVRPVLDVASHQGKRTVLVCVNEKALPVYRHWGFEVKETIQMPHDIVIWYMVRDP